MSPRKKGLIALALASLVFLPARLAQGQVDPNPNPVLDALHPPLNGLGAGTFTRAVRVMVPPFRGLEPRVALSYSSAGGNGLAGVGWSLSGFSVISRSRRARGVPRFDSEDRYLLGGRELLPCAEAPSTPSCTTGGTHATKTESFARIKYDSPSDSWSMWTNDGTRTDYTPVYVVPEGVLRWGQTAVTDTHGNTVSYAWQCEGGDCYPDSITFGPYSVQIYREARPDVLTFATGSDTVLGRTDTRLRSILVSYSGTPIRAYKLAYETSPTTSRTRLVSAQQYGKDVVIDAEGLITGGTAMPPRQFEYQDDPSAQTIERLW